MTCALCGLPVLPEDLVLLGGHVVCPACRYDVAAGLTPREFPDEWPDDERVAASVRRRVANRREEAAMRMQGALL